MTQRMYELINQCFIGTTDGKLSELNSVANIEKFAELIVQECIEQVEVFNVRMDARPRHIVEAIKQHFGVEQ